MMLLKLLKKVVKRRKRKRKLKIQQQLKIKVVKKALQPLKVVKKVLLFLMIRMVVVTKTMKNHRGKGKKRRVKKMRRSQKVRWATRCWQP